MSANVCVRPNLTENADYRVDLGVYDIDLGPVMLVSFNGYILGPALTNSSVRLVPQIIP